MILLLLALGAVAYFNVRRQQIEFSFLCRSLELPKGATISITHPTMLNADGFKLTIEKGAYTQQKGGRLVGPITLHPKPEANGLSSAFSITSKGDSPFTNAPVEISLKSRARLALKSDKENELLITGGAATIPLQGHPTLVATADRFAGPSGQELARDMTFTTDVEKDVANVTLDASPQLPGKADDVQFDISASIDGLAASSGLSSPDRLVTELIEVGWAEWDGDSQAVGGSHEVTVEGDLDYSIQVQHQADKSFLQVKGRGEAVSVKVNRKEIIPTNLERLLSASVTRRWEDMFVIMILFAGAAVLKRAVDIIVGRLLPQVKE